MDLLFYYFTIIAFINIISHYLSHFTNRKKGDSTKAIIKRITETPHAPYHGTGDDPPPDLSNLESGGDRAYTLQDVVSYFVKG